jgi:hypothetical protein
MLIHCAYLNATRRNQRFDFNILIEDGHRHSAQALTILSKARRTQLVFPSSKMLSVGLGSKADHPILQASDMLAYSMYQKWNDRDKDTPIYDALHLSSSSYTPQYIDLDNDLVDLVKEGVDEWREKKKAFGERKPVASKARRHIIRGAMEKETVRLLIQVLQILTSHTQEYWVKISAMERMLNSHPELKAEFQSQVRSLQNDPAVKTNHESSSGVLDRLRVMLLQDS